MNRKAIYGILGLLLVVAAVVIYVVGNKSSHLSELKDFWWYPLPLAALSLLGAATPNKRSK